MFFLLAFFFFMSYYSEVILQNSHKFRSFSPLQEHCSSYFTLFAFLLSQIFVMFDLKWFCASCSSLPFGARNTINVILLLWVLSFVSFFVWGPYLTFFCSILRILIMRTLSSCFNLFLSSFSNTGDFPDVTVSYLRVFTCLCHFVMVLDTLLYTVFRSVFFIFNMFALVRFLLCSCLRFFLHYWLAICQSIIFTCIH